MRPLVAHHVYAINTLSLLFRRANVYELSHSASTLAPPYLRAAKYHQRPYHQPLLT